MVVAQPDGFLLARASMQLTLIELLDERVACAGGATVRNVHVAGARACMCSCTCMCSSVQHVHACCMYMLLASTPEARTQLHPQGKLP